MQQYQEQEQSETIVTPKDELVGKVLAGKYQLIQRLGKGGMSVVYKAKHIALGKIYAVKLMHKNLLTDGNALVRFRQEAAAAAMLSHPNIITVHDYDSENDQPFQAIDYLEGQSLAERITESGPVEPERALHIFMQTCAGLQHAHSKGVIHRDLKPSNIMLIEHQGDPDFVKILDFGIAKLLPQEGQAVQQLTQTGEIFGSPFYMSPEQCLGQKMDARSDVYSLGCLMYETLTGEVPIAGTTIFQTIQKHLDDAPKPIREVIANKKESAKLVEKLEAVILKALAKASAQRQQSMQEMYDELQQIQSGYQASLLSILTRQFELLAIRTAPLRKRLPMRWMAVSAVTLLLLVCSLMWTTQIMLAGNIPAFAPREWPLMSLEPQSITHTGNDMVSTIHLASENIMKHVERSIAPPDVTARRLVSIIKSYAENGDYGNACDKAAYLKQRFEECAARNPAFEPLEVFGPGTTRVDTTQWFSLFGDACYQGKKFALASYFYQLSKDQLRGANEYTLRRMSMKQGDCVLRETARPTMEAYKAANNFFRQSAGLTEQQDYTKDSGSLIKVDARDVFCEDRAIWLSRLSEVEAALGHSQIAKLAAQSAATEWGKDSDSKIWAGQAYYALAKRYIGEGDWKNAEGALRQAIKYLTRATDPDSKTNLPAVWQDLSLVLSKKGAYFEALNATSQAHSLARELAKR